jgi:hypothetical protein
MKRFPLCVCLVLLLVVAVIPPVAATPTISRVSPETGPNYGDITLTVYGTGFNGNSSVMLSSCTTGDVIHGTVVSWSPTSLVCVFSIRNANPAKYHVIVNSPYTDTYGIYHYQDGCRLFQGFEIYPGTGTTYTTTTTTRTTTTPVATTAASSSGKNSIFIETNPNGATIFVDGKEVGTSSFSYYTDNDGTFNVVAKKVGYEDYAGQVTVVDGGPRARFYGLLTPLSSPAGTVTTTAPSSTYSSSVPISPASTIRKSTLKIPTPLGTYAPPAEESPVDPAIALWAAGIGIIFVAIRRR